MRDFIRLLTGRIAFERRARMMAIGEASQDAYLHRYGSAEVAAQHIYYFLLSGEFPH